MFATKTECRQYVVDCLLGHEDDYDLDGIVNVCFEYDEDEQGFVLCVGDDEFWNVCRNYDVTEDPSY